MSTMTPDRICVLGVRLVFGTIILFALTAAGSKPENVPHG